MKTNSYEIEKNVEKIKRGGYTGFIGRNIMKDIVKYLKGYNYNVYSCFDDCDKVILYTDDEPRIKLYRIDCYNELSHQSIMGSLFGLNISSDTFGDIVLFDGKFYVYLLDSISELVTSELIMIGNSYVELVEVDNNYLSNYKKNYERYEIIVSSLRIDTIISRIVNVNRDKAKLIIKDKLVTLNYEVLTKYDYVVKDNDIFSIRKFGKFKYRGIVKKTKKDNYIIWLDRYL